MYHVDLKMKSCLKFYKLVWLYDSVDRVILMELQAESRKLENFECSLSSRLKCIVRRRWHPHNITVVYDW